LEKKLGGGSFVELQNASETGSTIDSFRFRTLNRRRFNQIVVYALMVSFQVVAPYIRARRGEAWARRSM
jgi:hypothetical protein